MWEVSGVLDVDCVRRRRAAVWRSAWHFEVGGGDGADRWEITFSSLRGPPRVMSVVYGCRVGDGASRRRSRCSSGRYVNDESLIDGLTAREVCVDGAAHGLFGTQKPLLPLFARKDTQCQVWGVKVSSQGVCVFLQDHVAYVVDQVIFVDGDQSG
ncbi:hypothetical protein HYQ46_006620 [Verticillium longisporum]|nr:hypothetical protein HYQ46_006620 [Verticillium longisporum]